MYKTIRHGENSLQYTILPQNDDFRIEGKLTSAEGSSNNTGGSSSGGGSSKSRSSSGGGKAVKGATRRRSFFAYLGLIFVCTVIVGAVLIPFLVSAECLPSPTEWFLKTKAALINSSTSSGNGVVMHKASETSAPANVGVSAADKGRANANIGKTVRIINQNGIEKFILKVNKTTKEEAATFKQNATLNIGNGSAAVPQRPSLTPPLLPINNEQQPLNLPQHQISEVRFETVDQMSKSNRQSRLWPVMPTPQVLIVTTLRSDNNRSAGQPTTTTRTTPPLNTNMNTNTKQIIQSSSLDSVNVLNAPRVPAYANQSAMNQSSPSGIAPPTITTRIIQVPLLKSAAKKPIIPPILAKANSQSTTVLGMNVGSPPAVPALQTPQAAAAAAAIDNGLVGGVGQNHEISTNNGLGGKRSDWMNAHWSYINPSTYFQDWTGHKAEDSVLLPALLGFALIGMILIITVCLVARNKRTIVSSVRKRNRNDIEEQGAEDNATLLTTTNMSDDD